MDAHAHFERPEELPFRAGVTTVFCGVDPASAAALMPLAGPDIIVSCGLHPWHCDRYDVADMLPFIERCPILGEIGMDSVWTDVPLNRQRAVFLEQLRLAEKLGKPVVLHTKGMEAEIARIVADYPVRKLVHWYSCGEHLDAYLRQDCYFSVGPDHRTNPAVQDVIRTAPLNRLLTETDGVGAIGWALGREASPGDIEGVLTGELAAIARAHGVTMEAAAAAVRQNLNEFILGS